MGFLKQYFFHWHNSKLIQQYKRFFDSRRIDWPMILIHFIEFIIFENLIHYRNHECFLYEEATVFAKIIKRKQSTHTMSTFWIYITEKHPRSNSQLVFIMQI